MEDEGAGEKRGGGDRVSEGRIKYTGFSATEKLLSENSVYFLFLINRAFIVFLKQLDKSFLRIGKIIFSRSRNIKNSDSQRGVNLVVKHFRVFSCNHPVADEGGTNTGLGQMIGGNQLGDLHGQGRMDTSTRLNLS